MSTCGDFAATNRCSGPASCAIGIKACTCADGGTCQQGGFFPGGDSGCPCPPTLPPTASSGEKAAIGAGSAVAFLVLIGLVLLFVRRRLKLWRGLHPAVPVAEFVNPCCRSCCFSKRRAWQRQKKYWLFFSYTSLGEGSETYAQQLHRLTKEKFPYRKIFRDAENLDDIGKLETYVGRSTYLVILLSKEYLGRMNCLRELCAAVKKKVTIVVLVESEAKKIELIKYLGAVNEDSASEFVSDLLDKDTWHSMRKCDHTESDVLDALRKLRLIIFQVVQLNGSSSTGKKLSAVAQTELQKAIWSLPMGPNTSTLNAKRIELVLVNNDGDLENLQDYKSHELSPRKMLF